MTLPTATQQLLEACEIGGLASVKQSILDGADALVYTTDDIAEAPSEVLFLEKSSADVNRQLLLSET